VRFSSKHRAAPAEIEPWVPLLELLDASDAEVIRRWGRWYIADRDPRWVRRNALVALGNVGRPDDPDIRRCLTEYLATDDALLRAHAVWAARRLGLQALLPADDTDPLVAEELVAAL
jgi:epoxyqueuosine reductase